MKRGIQVRRAILFATLILLCVALVGIVYASWTGSIVAQGSISTGTFEVQFTGAVSNDPGDSVDPGQTQNVAATETVVTNQSVTVTIQNAYPGYTSRIVYQLTNTGTVPARVQVSVVPAGDSYGKISLTPSHMPTDPILPGASVTFFVDSTIEEDADQDSIYGYTVTITATQFNR